MNRAVAAHEFVLEGAYERKDGSVSFHQAMRRVSRARFHIIDGRRDDVAAPGLSSTGRSASVNPAACARARSSRSKAYRSMRTLGAMVSRTLRRKILRPV